MKLAVARHYGWAAVAGPDRMDWPTYAGARQALAEEFIGSLIREAEAAERAEAQQSTKHLREMGR